jgi:hypothetical protein
MGPLQPQSHNCCTTENDAPLLRELLEREFPPAAWFCENTTIRRIVFAIGGAMNQPIATIIAGVLIAAAIMVTNHRGSQPPVHHWQPGMQHSVG